MGPGQLDGIPDSNGFTLDIAGAGGQFEPTLRILADTEFEQVTGEVQVIDRCQHFEHVGQRVVHARVIDVGGWWRAVECRHQRLATAVAASILVVE